MIPSRVPFIQRESSGDADAIEMIEAGTGTSGQFDHEFIVVIAWHSVDASDGIDALLEDLPGGEVPKRKVPGALRPEQGHVHGTHERDQGLVRADV